METTGYLVLLTLALSFLVVISITGGLLLWRRYRRE